MRYRTICADPPWPLRESWPPGRMPRGAVQDGRRTPLPYPTMTIPEIAALPVATFAHPEGAHLYLWTIGRFVPDAYEVVRAWGFRDPKLLVWAKTPMGKGLGGTFASNCEFILFASRGKPKARRCVESRWFNWPRTGKHSRKPPASYDMIEQVSPGPYLELFARRPRLGWDVWGNEVVSNIEMAAD